MKITLNGKEKHFDSSLTLKELIAQSCANTSRVIAEVNGGIIRAPQWEQTPIKEDDTIELVGFVGGG